MTTKAYALTKNTPSRVLNRDDIGTLAPGFAADFVAFDLRQLGFAGALHDPVAALVFCSPAQVALAWVLQKSEITSPIVGATKPEHLRDAIASLELKLTAEEVTELEAPYVPHAVAGFN